MQNHRFYHIYIYIWYLTTIPLIQNRIRTTNGLPKLQQSKRFDGDTSLFQLFQFQYPIISLNCCWLYPIVFP